MAPVAARDFQVKARGTDKLFVVIFEAKYLPVYVFSVN